MRSYQIEVTGAKYVSAVVHVEANDNPGAIIQADAIVDDEFDWDETHSRTIIAVSNIALPNPIDAEDIMGEIEEGYNFEPEDEIILEFTPEGLDMPSEQEVAELADVDFFLDDEGEQVVVEREDISDEIEGGVSVEAYEQDGEGM